MFDRQTCGREEGFSCFLPLRAGFPSKLFEEKSLSPTTRVKLRLFAKAERFEPHELCMILTASHLSLPSIIKIKTAERIKDTPPIKLLTFAMLRHSFDLKSHGDNRKSYTYDTSKQKAPLSRSKKLCSSTSKSLIHQFSRRRIKRRSVQAA